MIQDQGDDAVMVLTASNVMDIEAIAKSLSISYAAMNMSVNPKKQLIARDKCEFLKRLHTSNRVESYRAYS